MSQKGGGLLDGGLITKPDFKTEGLLERGLIERREGGLIELL